MVGVVRGNILEGESSRDGKAVNTANGREIAGAVRKRCRVNCFCGSVGAGGLEGFVAAFETKTSLPVQ
jgi:hypothetical protein